VTTHQEDLELNEEPVIDGSPADGGPAASASSPAADAGASSGTHPALPVLDDAARSSDPAVCPFLRGDADGRLVAPAGEPREGQACVAIGTPRPQSTSQQELVCLRSAHVDCPRYQRGAMVPPVTPARSTPAIPRATLAALLILVLSAGISFGYVVQRGGLEMPGASPTPDGSAVAEVTSPTPEATVSLETEAPVVVQPATVAPSGAALPSDVPIASQDVSPSGEPSPTAQPSPSPSPVVTPSPTPSPTSSPTASSTARPTVKPTAKPTPKPTAKPTSTRYKLLKPCPDKAGCWIYTVHSGDNLFSIAKYFGHSLKTIYAWNPQYPATRLRVGAQIRMPAPTR
jgi:hypothetical protein